MTNGLQAQLHPLIGHLPFQHFLLFMQLFHQEITFDRFVRGALFLALIALLVLGLNWLSAVLIPFFAAWAIAWISPQSLLHQTAISSRHLHPHRRDSHCGGGFVAHRSAISRRHSPHQRCSLALSAKR